MAEENEARAPKLGEGHAAAMFRAGAKELSQALVALPDTNIRPVEEPGLVGCPTPQIVTSEMGAASGYQAMMDSWADHVQPRAQSNDKGIER